MVENACMGPANGPVRAVREGNGTIIEPILMIFGMCICLVFRLIWGILEKMVDIC